MSSAEAAESNFARRRRDNIVANAEILKGVSATAAKIIPSQAAVSKKASAPRASRPTRETRPHRQTTIKKEPQLGTRQSSRLAGRGVKEEGEDNGVSADGSKRKLDEDISMKREDEQRKRMRISGDLHLGDIKVEGRKWEGGVQGMESLKGLGLGLPLRGAQPGVRTFTDDDVTQTSDKDLKELRLRMGGLKLYEKWPVSDIKMTPQRIYSMGFHPTEEKPIIFAGDKEGAMGVFDASQEVSLTEDDDEGGQEYTSPVISAFKTHARTITSFLFSPVEANSVFTASYDCSIRKLDLEKGVSVETFAQDDLPITALDMPSDEPNYIIFSTLNGSLGRHDLRTKPAAADIWGLTDNKIGGFSLHPHQPHLVATASLDRTLKIWDLRKITGKGDLRHPALLGEHESRLSVSHASWSGGGHIATTSYDDTIKIYSFPDAGKWAAGHDIGAKQMAPSHVIRHNNQTGRWVTILKPHWQARPKDGLHKFAIANMNRFVDVFGADGEQLAQLEGEGITAVPAVAHFHPTMDWVAGGNGTGKLSLWM